jgi:hypothetical protein
MTANVVVKMRANLLEKMTAKMIVNSVQFNNKASQFDVSWRIFIIFSTSNLFVVQKSANDFIVSSFDLPNLPRELQKSNEILADFFIAFFNMGIKSLANNFPSNSCIQLYKFQYERSLNNSQL